MNEMFIDEQNPNSLRWAIFDDDGESAWLYLTEPEIEKPAADAFVYNRIKPIMKSEVEEYSDGPPPIAEFYANDQSVLSYPEKHFFSFVWSEDGDSVAVLKDGKPMAMIIRAQQYGYSKGVGVNGPWGHPWDEKLYKKLFAEQAGSQTFGG